MKMLLSPRHLNSTVSIGQSLPTRSQTDLAADRCLHSVPEPLRTRVTQKWCGGAECSAPRTMPSSSLHAFESVPTLAPRQNRKSRARKSTRTQSATDQQLTPRFPRAGSAGPTSDSAGSPCSFCAPEARAHGFVRVILPAVSCVVRKRSPRPIFALS